MREEDLEVKARLVEGWEQACGSTRRQQFAMDNIT